MAIGIDLGSPKLFGQYAGNDRCIVVAKLGDVLAALRTADTTPEARVILRLEELAEAETATSGFFGDGGTPAYTGWPLIYKRESFSEEREIRFVVKNRDGIYLKIPVSADCEVKKQLQRQRFAWSSLTGTLLAYETDLPFYRELIEKRAPNLSIRPLEGTLRGRLPHD